MRTPMEIHLSLLWISFEEKLTGNLQSTPAYKTGHVPFQVNLTTNC